MHADCLSSAPFIILSAWTHVTHSMADLTALSSFQKEARSIRGAFYQLPVDGKLTACLQKLLIASLVGTWVGRQAAAFVPEPKLEAEVSPGISYRGMYT